MNYARAKYIGFSAGIAGVVFAGYMATSGQYLQPGNAVTVASTGTTNAIPKFTSGTRLGDSSVTDDGTTLSHTTNLAAATAGGSGATGYAQIAADTTASTDSRNGLRFTAFSSGSNFIDSKSTTGGSTTFRVGAGAEAGSARTWLTVTNSSGAALFESTLGTKGDSNLGNDNNDLTSVTGHARVTSSPPAASSCGSSPGTPIGNDVAFSATTGSAGTTCTWTFSRTWTNRPICTAHTEGSATQPTCSVSATAITCSVVIASTTYDWICIGRPTST